MCGSEWCRCPLFLSIDFRNELRASSISRSFTIGRVEHPKADSTVNPPAMATSKPGGNCTKSTWSMPWKCGTSNHRILVSPAVVSSSRSPVVDASISCITVFAITSRIPSLDALIGISMLTCLRRPGLFSFAASRVFNSLVIASQLRSTCQCQTVTSTVTSESGRRRPKSGDFGLDGAFDKSAGARGSNDTGLTRSDREEATSSSISVSSYDATLGGLSSIFTLLHKIGNDLAVTFLLLSCQVLELD